MIYNETQNDVMQKNIRVYKGPNDNSNNSKISRTKNIIKSKIIIIIKKLLNLILKKI